MGLLRRLRRDRGDVRVKIIRLRPGWVLVGETSSHEFRTWIEAAVTMQVIQAACKVLDERRKK